MKLFGPQWSDGDRVDLGGVTVRLRVNPRARRVSIKVDALGGEAVAVAPDVHALRDAIAFAKSRRDWLADHLARRPRPQALSEDADLVVLGRPWRLVADGRRPSLEDDPDRAGGARLRGCGQGAVDAQLVARAVKREAARVFAERAEVHCRSLNRPRPPIGLIDARTRWGSCTPARPGKPASMRLSWRLALAPLWVADYVIAHECAHLIEANHSPRFWAVVRDLVGDEKAGRAWLRGNGPRLHALLPRPA